MNNCLFSRIARLFFISTTLFFCLSFTTVFAQEQKLITLKMENTTLDKVIAAIEKQSEYLFLIDQVDVKMTVSVNADKLPVSEVLKQMFSGKEDIKYDIRRGGISIFVKKAGIQKMNLQ